MVEEVLPEVPYAPLVFTIPKMLRPYFKFEHGLYGDLCRAAYQAIREFLEQHFVHLESPVPAFVACPQSFGSLLNFHPHCHGLVSMGVFDKNGDFYEDLAIHFSTWISRNALRRLQETGQDRRRTHRKHAILAPLGFSGTRAAQHRSR